VQCDKNKEFIEKIQGLSEANQHHLMKAIEQVNKSSSKTRCLSLTLSFRL
jgi:protein HOOK3